MRVGDLQYKIHTRSFSVPWPLLRGEVPCAKDAALIQNDLIQEWVTSKKYSYQICGNKPNGNTGRSSIIWFWIIG